MVLAKKWELAWKLCLWICKCGTPALILHVSCVTFVDNYAHCHFTPLGVPTESRLCAPQNREML